MFCSGFGYGYNGWNNWFFWLLLAGLGLWAYNSFRANRRPGQSGLLGEKCTACGAELADSWKNCPMCGKDKRS